MRSHVLGVQYAIALQGVLGHKALRKRGVQCVMVGRMATEMQSHLGGT